MPLNIGDYLADTMSLTAEQHGVYILLLMDYWKSGPLADDDRQLAATGKISPKAWKAEIGPVIRRFFFKGEDGHLHQKRADIEIAKTGRISEARRNAALDRHGRGTKPYSNAMQQACKSDANAQANPSQDGHKTEDIARVHALALPPPSEKKETSLREAKKTTPRGTRLPEDWTPGVDGAEFARSLGLDPTAVFSVFRDYWRGKAGSNGVKLDWQATWRNWCRKQAEGGSGNGLSFGPNRQPPSPNDWNRY